MKFRILAAFAVIFLLSVMSPATIVRVSVVRQLQPELYRPIKMVVDLAVRPASHGVCERSKMVNSV